MKKFLSCILCVLCLVNLICFFAFADYEDNVACLSGHINVTISKESPYSEGSYDRNMIRNPYYQKYYNELLAYSCNVYEKYIKNNETYDYISNYKKLHPYADEIYLTVIISDSAALDMGIKEYNTHILEKYFDKESVLYVSDYNYAAVVCINADEAESINEIKEFEFIGGAFFTTIPYVMADACGVVTMGNVFSDDEDNLISDSGQVTSADARYLLRYAAGLEDVGASKKFYFCADMDFDNDIDAADARLVLRTAAKMEKLQFISYSYFYFWDDCMSEIKK